MTQPSPNQSGERELARNARVDATIKTFLYVASLAFAQGREDDAEIYRSIVENIKLNANFEWVCCPVCEEDECDSDCSLAPIRNFES